MELIQNADDNSYDANKEPTLNLRYSDRTLRVDCNETGFGKENVEAICKIGRSTKTGLGKTTRYIGEKGIGFKSVFKVSDVVWISSGHYSFKFDKQQVLGMLAPVWEEFPEPILPGYTSIILQLSEDYDPGDLIADIEMLDPRLLIFLRQLRHISLETVFPDSSVRNSTLRRHDQPFENESQMVMKLWYNTNISSFINIKIPLDDLPPDAKRPGTTQSEMIMAFPVSPTNVPYIGAQDVYAFLPIRNYGFRVRDLLRDLVIAG